MSSSAGPAPDLPRNQLGPNPQHLLVTLLGDFWRDSERSLPSAGLVALLNEFGISDASARSALSRLARRDVLESSKDGRQTFYRLNRAVVAAGIETLKSLVHFGSPKARGNDWDGTWLVVVFTMPDEQSRLRSILRSTLRRRGFALLQDGVWISARGDDEALVRELEELGVDNVTAFRSSMIFPTAGGGNTPASAWQLDDIAQDYRRFIEKFGPLRDGARRGELDPSQALIGRTEVMDAWRGFYRHDPNLPQSLLPSDWPRGEANEIFTESYDALGELAELRCREIVRPFSAECASDAHHFTTGQIAQPR